MDGAGVDKRPSKGLGGAEEGGVGAEMGRRGA